MEVDRDYITIMTDSNFFRYNGNKGPVPKAPTTTSLVGIISQNLMIVNFYRYISSSLLCYF